MSAITLDQMKSKLLTEDQVMNLLATTEPLAVSNLSSDTSISFSLSPDWAEGIDAVRLDATLGGVLMSVSGTEYEITKEAFFQAISTTGLSTPYATKRIPGRTLQGLLNYHYGVGMGQTELAMFTVKDRISAFTRPTIQPFSNIELAENVIAGIRKRHGSDLPIFADYKIHNSLQETNVRFIIPATDHVMVDTNMSDVPESASDVWLAGVHLRNSAIGKGQTTLESYMFRWWCTNGATSTLGDVGTWSRRINGQQDDVYSWAREQVDEVLGGMEARFDEIQALAKLNLAGNTADVLREIFTTHAVPVSQRDVIMARLLESETLTMYSVMSAITQAANEDDLEDKRRDRLMRIGGAIPTEQFDTLKARVWREGHLAKSNEPNPYEVRVS